jgi:pimeloyl-ACP methyl ester carboxylesterase
MDPHLQSLHIYTKNHETAMQAQGRFVIEVILPALWKQYSQYEISNVVLYGHGIGAAIVTIAAGLYSRNVTPSSSTFILAGVVLSSIAINAERARTPPPASPTGATGGFPLDVKDELMLGGPGTTFTAQYMLDKTEELNTPAPHEEVYDISWQWPTYWQSYTEQITMPVLHIIEESSPMWGDGVKGQDEFIKGFKKTWVI